MTTDRCKWTDGEYVTPGGETCDTPRNAHCTARRSCGIHLQWGELTCARCLGRTRTNIRHIGQYAALLDSAALEAGRVDVEISMLAGPSCDPEAWSWRKATARTGLTWHVSLDEDDDETDPKRVLTTWAQMLSEDYRLPRPERWDVSNAAAFLERILSRVAQDDGQDFPQLSREMRKCRDHLDAELRVRWFAERGVPCPSCADQKTFVRLVHEYSHWCVDESCARIHVTDESEDRWVCPRDQAHQWTTKAYSNYLQERRGA